MIGPAGGGVKRRARGRPRSATVGPSRPRSTACGHSRPTASCGWARPGGAGAGRHVAGGRRGVGGRPRTRPPHAPCCTTAGDRTPAPLPRSGTVAGHRSRAGWGRPGGRLRTPPGWPAGSPAGAASGAPGTRRGAPPARRGGQTRPAAGAGPKASPAGSAWRPPISSAASCPLGRHAAARPAVLRAARRGGAPRPYAPPGRACRRAARGRRGRAPLRSGRRSHSAPR